MGKTDGTADGTMERVGRSSIGEKIRRLRTEYNLFKSEITHRWRNPSESDARVIYVLTPPSFSPEVDVHG